MPTTIIRCETPLSPAAHCERHHIRSLMCAIPRPFHTLPQHSFPPTGPRSRGAFAGTAAAAVPFPPLPFPSLLPRDSESLLSTTTRLYPFALLAACEQAVELLGFGSFSSEGDFRVSSPHPGLADVAGSVLRLGGGGGAGSAARIGGGGSRGRGMSRSGLGGGEGGELPAILVQV